VVDPQGIILDGHEWMAMRPRQIFNITRRALGRFFSERSWRLAAGVTFFTLFAVTPLLLLVAAVGGLLVDRALLQEQFTTQLEGLFGSASAEALREMVRSFRDPTSSISAFVLAGVSLIFGATNAFGHLRHAINVIWGVREPNEKFQASFFVYVGVLGLIILMLLSTQVISSAILMAESVVPEGLPLEFLLSELVNIAITGTLIAILCAIVCLLSDYGQRDLGVRSLQLGDHVHDVDLFLCADAADWCGVRPGIFRGARRAVPVARWFVARAASNGGGAFLVVAAGCVAHTPTTALPRVRPQTLHCVVTVFPRTHQHPADMRWSRKPVPHSP
jgi:hypothetical protein